jgi:hypothetical protein
MDREWFCRIAERYPPHIIDHDVAMFRWHAASKSSSAKASKHFKRYTEERSIVASRYLPSLKPIIEFAPRISLFILEQIARVLKICLRVKRMIAVTRENRGRL